VQKSVPNGIFDEWQDITSYKCCIVTSGLGGTTVELHAIKIYPQEKEQLDALRENKPPPNTAIRRIRISDFGLPDPKRDPDRHQNCITWSLSHALPLQKISSKSVHKFASNPTDRQTDQQTDKQTDKQTELKT